MPSSSGKLIIDPLSATAKPTGITLQNMARKISRKNHKIAQQRQQGLFTQRRCPSCGHLTPSLKKRCQQCQSFLVGRACPACNELNHNRSIFCSKCHTSLYPDKSGVNVKLGTIQVSYTQWFLFCLDPELIQFFGQSKPVQKLLSITLIEHTPWTKYPNRTIRSIVWNDYFSSFFYQ